MTKRHIQTNILQLLQQHGHGLATPEIYTKVGRERHTVTKYLERLHAEGLIQYREIGKTRLWSIVPSPLLAVLQKEEMVSQNIKELFNTMNQKVTIVSKDKTILWSNQATAEKKCFERYGNASICKGCPAEKIIKTGKSTTLQVSLGKRVQIAPLKDHVGNTFAFIETSQK
ncbi:helix-turn-helix transcriptional regulator [Candidatus Woesearchaeota archaeon]|nr:helix-turn-helix transcriptional regulator [Candidatus Woesearchaeota archaeon]